MKDVELQFGVYVPAFPTNNAKEVTMWQMIKHSIVNLLLKAASALEKNALYDFINEKVVQRMNIEGEEHRMETLSLCEKLSKSEVNVKLLSDENAVLKERIVFFESLNILD